MNPNKPRTYLQPSGGLASAPRALPVRPEVHDLVQVLDVLELEAALPGLLLLHRRRQLLLLLLLLRQRQRHNLHHHLLDGHYDVLDLVVVVLVLVLAERLVLALAARRQRELELPGARRPALVLMMMMMVPAGPATKTRTALELLERDEAGRALGVAAQGHAADEGTGEPRGWAGRLGAGQRHRGCQGFAARRSLACGWVMRNGALDV